MVVTLGQQTTLTAALARATDEFKPIASSLLFLLGPVQEIWRREKDEDTAWAAVLVSLSRAALPLAQGLFAVTIEAVEEDMVEFFFGSCCEEERSKEGEDE